MTADNKPRSLPMMPLWVRDHIAATRHMTLTERGALVDLLCFAWDMGPLPRDPVRLAALLGCSAADWKRIWPALRPLFTRTPAGLVHPRLEIERKKALEMRARAADKARTAAAVRWEKDGRNSGPVHVANLLGRK